jgi:ABC-type multidrug transport system fused ATPase/permease subunit
MESFQNGVTGFERFVEILDTPVEADNPDAVDIPTIDGVIEFKNVTYGYGDGDNVLKNVTLAPLLLLNDKIKQYRKQLSADKSLSFKQKKENLNQFKRQEKEIIEQNAIALLEQMGLKEKINAYPCELSGGQSQRVAITRALALNTKVLCFDEPTSALDPELTCEVLKAIRSLKNQDRTMIIVTHEMGFAKNVSDKIIFLHDGVVEEEGKPKQIFSSPKSEKLKSFLSNISNKEEE